MSQDCASESRSNRAGQGRPVAPGKVIHGQVQLSISQFAGVWCGGNHDSVALFRAVLPLP